MILGNWATIHKSPASNSYIINLAPTVENQPTWNPSEEAEIYFSTLDFRFCLNCLSLPHLAVLVEPGRFGQLLISCVKLFKVDGSCWWISDVGYTVDEYFKWFNSFERGGRRTGRASFLHHFLSLFNCSHLEREIQENISSFHQIRLARYGLRTCS